MRMLMSPAAYIVYQLKMNFEWLHLPKRLPIAVVSLWLKHGNMKMLVDLRTKKTTIMDGTNVFKVYDNPLDAHKDKAILDHWVEKYGIPSMRRKRYVNKG